MKAKEQTELQLRRDVKARESILQVCQKKKTQESVGSLPNAKGN